MIGAHVLVAIAAVVLADEVPLVDPGPTRRWSSQVARRSDRQWRRQCASLSEAVDQRSPAAAWRGAPAVRLVLSAAVRGGRSLGSRLGRRRRSSPLRCRGRRSSSMRSPPRRCPPALFAVHGGRPDLTLARRRRSGWPARRAGARNGRRPGRCGASGRSAIALGGPSPQMAGWSIGSVAARRRLRRRGEAARERPGRLARESAGSCESS